MIEINLPTFKKEMPAAPIIDAGPPPTRKGITPSDVQYRAIRAIIEWYGDKNRKEFYLAGYAGTGKSTIVDFAIEELKEKYNISRICTATYTGKAASVLRKKGVENAQTIHSLIYKPHEKENGEIAFSLSYESDLEDAHLVVLDECSMIDDALAHDLRSFNKKILIIGDPGQLPPVSGQGAFTNREPDAFLSEIRRQSLESPIIELATMARSGDRLPMFYKKGDVEVRPFSANESLIFNPDTQVLCGVNRNRYYWTQAIRKKLGFTDPFPAVGERVIACKNNPGHGFFNGSMGVLQSIIMKEMEANTGNKETVLQMSVKMDDFETPFKNLFTDPALFANHFGIVQSGPKLKVNGIWLNEFDWAYLITCHKAQGSSWNHVTVLDDSLSFREHSSKWLYTAITRAENGLMVLAR